MAIYRNIQMSFWTDTKVVDDFTPEDKYFYLYLMTNPHTNLAGCYEISIKQASLETGYNEDAVRTLLDRFENVHNTIRYSKGSKEVLILNWSRFNWTKSKDFKTALIKEIESVKSLEFKRFLEEKIESGNTNPSPSIDGGETTVTDTDTVTDTVNNTKLKKTELKDEFESLWKIYPKKQGKDKAYGYYERARRSGVTYEEVEDGVLKYIAFIEANEYDMQFVKMGSTFFSQKAWQDDWTIRTKQRKRNNPFTEMLMEGDGQ